jgi:MFS family permease
MTTQRQAGIVQGIILSLVTFLPIMATVSLAPGIPLFLNHFKNVAHVSALVPMLITVPAVMIAIASPFAGALSDAVGRKRVLLAAVALYGVCGMAPLVLDNIYSLLGSRIGVGAAEGMLMTVGKTLIGDYFAGERRQRWIGYQSGIDACLGSLTWLLGGVLAGGNWRGPFLLYTISVPVLFTLYPMPPPPPGWYREIPPRREFPWRMMGIIRHSFSDEPDVFLVPVNIPARDPGIDSSGRIGALTAIASPGPLGALLYARSRVHSSPILIGIALGCIGIAFIGIGLVHDYRLAIAFGFLEQVGNGIAGAATVTWTLSCLPFEHRGRGMGMWSAFLVAGIFLSPMVFGLISSQTGGTATGFLYLGFVCAAASLVIGSLRSLRFSGAASAAC